MAMEMKLSVWVEDPNDPEKVVPADVVIQHLVKKKGEKTMLRLTPIQGNIERDFFDIDLDDLRVICGSFSSYDNKDVPF
jgi:hypothetical protein